MIPFEFKRPLFPFFVLFLFGLLGVTSTLSPCRAEGNHPVVPPIQVKLLSEDKAIQPGTPTRVAIDFQIPAGWHLYWKNPGDSGESARVKWEVPSGIQMGPLAWPVPSVIQTGPLNTFGFSNSLFLMSDLIPSASLDARPILIQAQVHWLACQQVCVPGHTSLQLNLPVIQQKPSSTADQSLFTAAEKNLPLPFPKEEKIQAYSERDQFIFQIQAQKGHSFQKIQFFPYTRGLLLTSPPTLRQTPEGMEIELKKSKTALGKTAPEKLTGILQMDGQSFEVDLPVISREGHSPLRADEPTPFLGKILLFAFLAGLILNFMPCVFPVLFIKALNLIEHLQPKNARRVYLQSVAYTLGILVSFWILGFLILTLRNAGQWIGWGFQLQSPVFVSLLSGVYFLMALNLLGVFEVGGSWMGFGTHLTQRKGYLGSFFTGLLATVVATPCTAPFMGSAISFALTQTWSVTLLVFSALGLGLAAPYCLLATRPILVKKLPKPGRWMETLKQFMAFPLLGTVVWLICVLTLQAGIDALSKALLSYLFLGMAAWCWGRWKLPSIQLLAIFLVVSAVLVQLVGFHLVEDPSLVSTAPGTPPADSQKTEWEPFTEGRLNELLKAHRSVFIDFTAAWCITCKINEQVALTRPVLEAFQKKQVVLIRGDWTRADPAITRTLHQYGRSGVPLYLLFDGKNSSPRILPQILTPSLLLRAIEEIGS